jgi:hypothetical protein
MKLSQANSWLALKRYLLVLSRTPTQTTAINTRDTEATFIADPTRSCMSTLLAGTTEIRCKPALLNKLHPHYMFD